MQYYSLNITSKLFKYSKNN